MSSRFGGGNTVGRKRHQGFWATLEWKANQQMDATLRDNPVVQVNHHCALPGEVTGGLCASHYLFSELATDAPLYFADDAAGKASDGTEVVGTGFMPLGIGSDRLDWRGSVSGGGGAQFRSQHLSEASVFSGG